MVIRVYLGHKFSWISHEFLINYFCWNSSNSRYYTWWSIGGSTNQFCRSLFARPQMLRYLTYVPNAVSLIEYVGTLIIIICTRKAGCSVFLGVKNKKDREGMLIVIFFWTFATEIHNITYENKDVYRNSSGRFSFVQISKHVTFWLSNTSTQHEMTRAECS